MKILHVITRMIVGGAQENTLLTCEGLRARGHEVVLLTGPSEGPEGTLMERAGRGGYEVRVTEHLVRSPHPWHDWRAYREIKRVCREMRPEVVHTHSSKAGIVGRAAAWAAREAGVPSVVHTVHGLAFGPFERPAANRLWIELERWAARRCDAIVSVAEAMTRQALAAGIGRAEQYTTVYSGMEVEPFLEPGVSGGEVRARLGIPEERVVFGTIARLQPLKGHDDLLAVAGEVLRQVPRAHFLWVGDGKFRARLERTIRERGWEGHFTLTGLIPPAEVPRVLPAMDVVVHPSYREGLARALPQGLLAGKAVISYDCDGAGEVCVPERTGVLVKTGDAQGLGRAIVWMAEHDEQRRAMGEAGRSLCLERFPARVMVDKIEALYRHLADGRGTRT